LPAACLPLLLLPTADCRKSAQNLRLFRGNAQILRFSPYLTQPPPVPPATCLLLAYRSCPIRPPTAVKVLKICAYFEEMLKFCTYGGAACGGAFGVRAATARTGAFDGRAAAAHDTLAVGCEDARPGGRRSGNEEEPPRGRLLISFSIQFSECSPPTGDSSARAPVRSNRWRSGG